MPSDSNASEQAIEDILAQSPHILASLLDVDPTALVPVARQQSLFYSDLTYSLIAVDSVFELSKNSHSVPRS